jgi:hypothetical protein
MALVVALSTSPKRGAGRDPCVQPTSPTRFPRLPFRRPLAYRNCHERAAQCHDLPVNAHRFLNTYHYRNGDAVSTLHALVAVAIDVLDGELGRRQHGRSRLAVREQVEDDDNRRAADEGAEGAGEEAEEGRGAHAQGAAGGGTQEANRGPARKGGQR